MKNYSFIKKYIIQQLSCGTLALASYVIVEIKYKIWTSALASYSYCGDSV